jgi:hypothetical protein
MRDLICALLVVHEFSGRSMREAQVVPQPGDAEVVASLFRQCQAALVGVPGAGVVAGSPVCQSEIRVDFAQLTGMRFGVEEFEREFSLPEGFRKACEVA